MPELPEVETVRQLLKREVVGKKIKSVNLFYPKIIDYPNTEIFKEQIINEMINDIKRRGKWLIFELDHYYLLSHLRMEGKYNLKKQGDLVGKHEHVSFLFEDNLELRYQDTRKFGRMSLILKDDLTTAKQLLSLGLEPWDKDLTVDYLKSKYQHKRLPIKSVLLDQRIVVGIGNIYANEILFMSKINPLKKTNELTDQELKMIIKNTMIVLDKAILAGGTTVRTFTAGIGIHGRYQDELLVHGKEGQPCLVCGSKVLKMKVGGRGTYYCPVCQK